MSARTTFLVVLGVVTSVSCASATSPTAVPRPTETPVTPAASDAAPSTSTLTPTTTPTTTATTATTTTTTTTMPQTPDALVNPCPVPAATPAPIDGDAVTASAALVAALVCASTDVVVTAPETADDTAIRAAIEMGAPLVLATVAAPYDPAGLGAARAWTTNAALVVPGDHAILPVPATHAEIPPLVSSMLNGRVPEDGLSGIVTAVVEGAVAAETLVMVSPARPELAASAATAARAVQGEAVWAVPGDLRRRRILAPLAEASTSRLLVGNFAADAAWQADVLARGLTLPGGRQVLFPETRIVALYGHPHTSALGVLGEQSPAESVLRAADVAAPYATDDVRLLPAFELIATLAASNPGADGDYSSELSVEDLLPWVDAATEAGYYVVLDLQPGRADFLTQAQRYEELLRLPNVGLALDPEWRLGPDERHLDQIGSVSGAEVNTVVRWLADVVRRERLPQKLLMVHQFTFGMISDRSTIETPPELAVVVQMDGQGPLSTKFSTWNALLVGGNDWDWGWKNFYDEDEPMATPSQILDLEPVPVFISFQ